VESHDFFGLVRDYFGAKATDEVVAHSTSVYRCTLYETFRFECGLDGEHGEFGGGIEYAPGAFHTTFFNERLSLNDDAASILANLRLVDEWCRLHLPDTFLERYAAAIGLDG
jgi:hypothetical protein